jgi:hypothetical protein
MYFSVRARWSVPRARQTLPHITMAMGRDGLDMEQEWDPPMAAESIGYPQPACSTEGKHGRPDYTQGAPVILLSCRGSCVIQLSIALTKYLGKST